MDLKDKKVLLVGLGILGGGVATAKWLYEQGAVLTVTDLKDAEYLKNSLAKLKDLNTDNIDSAIATVSGTARSMGIKVA